MGGGGILPCKATDLVQVSGASCSDERNLGVFFHFECDLTEQLLFLFHNSKKLKKICYFLCVGVSVHYNGKI